MIEKNIFGKNNQIKGVHYALDDFIQNPTEKNTDKFIMRLLRFIISEVKRHCSIEFLLANDISADAVFATYGVNIGDINILNYIGNDEHIKIIDEIDFWMSIEYDKINTSKLKDL